MKLDKSGSDVYYLSNEFYKFDEWKNRGIGYDHSKKVEVEHLDSRIDDNGDFYILVRSSKTRHIKSGILYNRLRDVGKLEKYEKKINLNSDKKRLWLADLESLKDQKLCDSVPIPADLVADLILNDEGMICAWY